MSIDLIRICGAFFIFLCHACSESGSSIGVALGQVFNVGVPIFFILSGYLHGQRTAPTSKLRWYLKKLKRLLMPLYIFVVILAVLYRVVGLPIDMSCWWQTIVPICGLTQIYIPGCGQLWFLTHLLVCYLITPVLQGCDRLKRRGIALMALTWFAFCMVLAYTVPPIWCTLLNSILSYTIGFYALPYLLNRKRSYSLLIGIAVLSCCCRLTFRHFFDETPFYNSVATELCALVLALSVIVFLFQVGELFETTASSSVKLCVAALGKRTYGFYLVHYIFLTGPLKMQNFQSAFLNMAVAFLLSSVLSEFVFQVEKMILKK
mgnify:FL=1